MNIYITAENAAALPGFEPVSGTWRIDGDRPESLSDVEVSVRNWMDADFKIEVRVYHADGRVITGDVPSEGTYLATRA